jgi:excisionase family DNA binding protein
MPVNTQPLKDHLAIMTVHEVADYLRMSQSKVYRLVRERRIPAVRIGKSWRFRRDLLDNWLRESVELHSRSDGKQDPVA